jgi:hypothetical protein
LWQIGKAASATIRDFDNQIGMPRSEPRTVNTDGKRFN